MGNPNTTSDAQRRRYIFCLMSLAGIAGCSPADYRRDADQETYGIIAEKADDARWRIPGVSVEPAVSSRLHDPFDPDEPPLPPDDPAAHRYMGGDEKKKGCCGWHEQGDAPSVEDPAWRKLLDLSKNGTLLLSPERAVELGLLHSREYQTEVENLYLTALALTLQRFEFDIQWFLQHASALSRTREQSDSGESKAIETTTAAGLNRAFAAGGQLIVDLANTFVWEFAGTESTFVSSRLAAIFIQPLLRGAGRKIRLEGLTQSERDTLYAVREFARFRKRFYFEIVAGDGGFLSLLLQLQAIRNLEANLGSLRRNLEEHEALADAGIVSQIQVDQVFQSHQAGRLALTEARNEFESALDDYKIQLGLPPEVPVDVDDARLAPFQLDTPELTALKEEVEAFLAEYREMDEPPTLEVMRQGFAALHGYRTRLVGLDAEVKRELERWKSRAAAPGAVDGGSARESSAREQLSSRLGETEADLEALKESLDAASGALTQQDRRAGWESLQRLARLELSMIADLFVIQTQVRAYLIRLPSFEVEPAAALKRARAARLDLMNERAEVVDAWRKVKVAADALGADLNLVLAADIGTKPGSDNALRFSERTSRYRAGFQLDGPLNRMAERNVYRAALIDYQRARRDYMELEDRVSRAVRRDLRQLAADRLNFEIARQSLIAAARQVEESRDQLAAPGPAGDSSSTQDVLDALQSLLQAKNALIGTWIAYETNRLQLLLNMEELEMDERGEDP